MDVIAATHQGEVELWPDREEEEESPIWTPNGARK